MHRGDHAGGHDPVRGGDRRGIERDAGAEQGAAESVSKDSSFSEEKEEKRLHLFARGGARFSRAADTANIQKFFGSFFQKEPLSFPPLPFLVSSPA
jgi:hypothetical protein